MKMTILTKENYRFNIILIKLPVTFFKKLKQKFCVETQRTPNSQSNIEKEKWTWRNQGP